MDKAYLLLEVVDGDARPYSVGLDKEKVEREVQRLNNEQSEEWARDQAAWESGERFRRGEAYEGASISYEYKEIDLVT